MFDSAVVTGDTLVLTYDEALDTTSTPAVGAFSIGGPLVSVNTVAISGMTVTLTLSAAVASGDTVTVSYTLGTDPLRDAAMNNVAALTNVAVTNNTAAPTPPSPPTAVIDFQRCGGGLNGFLDGTFTSTGGWVSRAVPPRQRHVDAAGPWAGGGDGHDHAHLH